MTSRPEQIDMPAAWKGGDLASKPERWVWTLTANECAELEAAAETYLAGGREIGAVTAAAFPLPTVAPRLARLRSTLQHGIGFELIRGLEIDGWAIEKAATLFCGIGAHLGSARSQNAAGHILGHVTDVGADYEVPNVRIYQTSARQSFHTDSSDVVGLLCLKEAMEGGGSMLVSTVAIYNEMNRQRPDLVRVLFDPVATDRRGEVPDGANPWFDIPVLNWHQGLLTGIYQRTYIDSAARFAEAPQLSPIQIEALDLFDRIANDPDMYLPMRLRPGDMQFVYNHTLLHDRTGFRDWPDDKDRRHLLRLWLALPDDRPLPPIFAQRYGPIEVGNRGGIVCKETQLSFSLTP